jgi:hypothetical protein
MIRSIKNKEINQKKQQKQYVTPPRTIAQKISLHDVDSSWLSPQIIKKVKYYAARVNKLYGPPMALANIEDVEQDLLCELCCAIKNYDSHKGTVAAFCEIVLQHRIRNYLRDRLTKKKGRHAIQISEEENILSSDTSDQLTESMDANVVIKSLPLHEQIIVSIIQNHSVAEASRFFNASSNEFHYIVQVQKDMRRN